MGLLLRRMSSLALAANNVRNGLGLPLSDRIPITSLITATCSQSALLSMLKLEPRWCIFIKFPEALLPGCLSCWRPCRNWGRRRPGSGEKGSSPAEGLWCREKRGSGIVPCSCCCSLLESLALLISWVTVLLVHVAALNI
jgi:hypothetical protein